MDDLALNIRDALDQINAALPPGRGPPSATLAAPIKPIAGRPTAGMKVFLAEAHPEFNDDRQQLLRELASHGLTVLPAAALSTGDPAQFRQQVGQALAECDLAVHLVGARRASVLSDEDDTVVLQNQLTAECSARAAPQRLIWLPAHRLLVPPSADRPRQFIELLRSDAAAQRGAELLTLPLQGLIACVHDTLEKVRLSRLPTERPVSPVGNGPPPVVYLAANPADADWVKPVREPLFDQGFDVLELLFDAGADENAIAAWHKSNLDECNAILVCVGRANVNGWRAQSGELRKAEGLRGGRKLAAKGVYLGPPNAQFKEVLQMQGVLVCNAVAGFAPALLQRFGDLARQALATAAAAATPG